MCVIYRPLDIWWHNFVYEPENALEDLYIPKTYTQKVLNERATASLSFLLLFIFYVFLRDNVDGA